MKKFIIILPVLIILFNACKEKEMSLPAAATINVINTLPVALKVNPTGKPRSWAGVTQTIGFGTRAFYYAPLGMTNIKVVPALDTASIIFNHTYNFQSKLYTMYLSGTMTSIDTIFREEKDYPIVFTDVKIPKSADSMVNIRFVNLSVGSPALKVKQATSIVNEVDNLPYKGISLWKGYPAKLVSTTYSFQIRNAQTDALITTYSFVANAANRFKNVALVIRGVYGTTGATGFGISPMNYF